MEGCRRRCGNVGPNGVGIQAWWERWENRSGSSTVRHLRSALQRHGEKLKGSRAKQVSAMTTWLPQGGVAADHRGCGAPDDKRRRFRRHRLEGRSPRPQVPARDRALRNRLVRNLELTQSSTKKCPTQPGTFRLLTEIPYCGIISSPWEPDSATAGCLIM